MVTAASRRLSFREAWFHLSEEYPIKYESERLPPPFIADLNGEGKSEVLVATHDAKIQNHREDKYMVDQVKLVSCLRCPCFLHKIRVPSGRRPAAMANRHRRPCVQAWGWGKTDFGYIKMIILSFGGFQKCCCSYEKEGIEAVHLATGRTVCKLHLPEGGHPAEINGDGVLDHVQVVGGIGYAQTVVGGSMELLTPCRVVATSGIPVQETS